VAPSPPWWASRTVAGTGAVVVGALTAYQSRVNGELAVATGNGVQAAVVSFGSGWLILTVLLVLVARYRHGVAAVVSAVRQRRMPWWQVMGGVFGGFFVGVQSVTVPLIGVAVFTVAVVAGQSGSSLAVDRAGFGPAGRQPITGARVVSAILAVAAVGIAVSDQLEGLSLAGVWPILIAILAGVFIAFQQAINGRVAAVARQPISAAFVNFTLGFALLGGALGIAWALSDIDPGPLPAGPWWIYTGGAVGVIFIATAAWVVQRLGVLLFVLLSVSGQLIGALLLDVIAPTPGTSVHATLVAGVLVAGAAVAIGTLPQWWARARPMPRHEPPRPRDRR
jgi:bacterial/archaeal transporter family-2 protein